MTNYPHWMRKWDEGNGDGEGYAVGVESDTPREAVESEGWIVLEETESGQVLATDDAHNLFAVADNNGPWCVEVTVP
tara:strand:+ start:77 stop:307 length:231 start_codon:yes stop_codon:yes gene_type:complete